MKPIIYLDMDGVLADFEGYAYGVCPEWKTEIEKKNWGRFGSELELFAKLSPMTDALELYHGCVEVAGDKNLVQILTALPNRADFKHAAKDKIDWARKYISPDIRVHFGPYAQDKQYHQQHPYDVLIDDKELNIAQWENAGGIGIVHRTAAESLSALTACYMTKLARENGEYA